MNEDIRYEDICDRLKLHTAQSMEEFDFAAVFPDVRYHYRKHTPDVIHVGDWFIVEAERIWQVSAYGNSPSFVLLLFEPILAFGEQVAAA